MTRAGNGDNPDAADGLDRFLWAQEGVYGQALAELTQGRKRSHWMWFIFPQIAGLGQSATSRHYAIRDADEAGRYLGHPLLGSRLRECTQALLAMEGRSAGEIFGHPDDRKLRSSMTLFDAVAGGEPLFSRVLDRYFRGERDARTLDLLRAPEH